MTSHDSDKRSAERRIALRLPPREVGLAVNLASLAPGRRPLKGELVNVSSTGLAIWLSKELPKGSHWLLSMQESEGAGVPVKMMRAKPGFGGFVHGFQFSSHQATLADRLSGLSGPKPGKAPKF